MATTSSRQEQQISDAQDVQIEFLWTVVWAYLSAWTGGAPIVFPPESTTWSNTGLFFLLCLGFYELKTGATTNPAYWVKDYLVDEISQRKPRKATFERMLLMAAVDVCGHMAGFWLFLKTLDSMGETAALEIVAQPPAFKNCGWIWAFIVEIIVTSGTQLSTTIAEALGFTERLGNLVSSLIGVYVFMVWGIPYTGAVMNPASSLAATLISGRFARKSFLSIFVLFRTIVIFQIAPILGAIVSGILEGGLVRDRIRREKFE